MTPATGTALLLIGLFVLPGFVTLILRERSHVVQRSDPPFERLLNALLYSSLVYGLVISVAWILGLRKAHLVDFYKGEMSLGAHLLAALLIVLVTPAVVTWLGVQWQRRPFRSRVLKLIGVSSAHEIRSGWNSVFAREGTALVRLRLKSGIVVGGFYGINSMAGYSEHGGDIYIDQRWTFDEDDWFKEPTQDSLGIWISADEIATLELYDAPSGGTDES